jgi:hypothetical protein
MSILKRMEPDVVGNKKKLMVNISALAPETLEALRNALCD